MSKIIIEYEEAGELKTLVKGALENEKKMINVGIRKTIDNIKEFEDKYKMDSASFYQKYSNGELGDAIGYIRWAGEIETLKRLQQNFKELSEAEVC
ncbi:MAG: hypothetical protein HY957_10055 [Nitrospirae bacterium]|nr:hypothetical protein [Nitrospirota bacterium]